MLPVPVAWITASLGAVTCAETIPANATIAQKTRMDVRIASFFCIIIEMMLQVDEIKSCFDCENN